MSKPKPNQLFEELPELAPDREQGLSSNFEDIALDELISVGSESGASLLEETAAAVHELVLGENAGKMSAPTDLLEIPTDLSEMESEPGLNDAAILRSEMCDRFFDLVNCELPFQELADVSLMSLMEAVQGEAGSILELDHLKSEYFFRSARGGDAEKLRAFRVPAGKGIVGKVMDTKTPVLLRTMEGDDTELKAIGLSAGLSARGCIAVPILVKDHIFGAVEIFNKTAGRSFDEQDLAILADGARMLGKVLEVRFLMAALVKRAG